MKVSGSKAKTIYHLKKIQGLYPLWRLEYKIKCGSTEHELSKLLDCLELKRNQPIAVVTRQQFAGFGQNSRFWFSPEGGIWLSAAYPIFSERFDCKIFNLSMAIKLCEMLKQENIKVNLKWPNDIFFGSRKLIGFLPRVITRGKEISYVRVGIGMNLINRTPSEGISLAEILKTKHINKSFWTAKILKAFHDSINCNKENEYVIKVANDFLSRVFLPQGFSSAEWNIEDIDSHGYLRLYNKTQKILKRF